LEGKTPLLLGGREDNAGIVALYCGNPVDTYLKNCIFAVFPFQAC